MLTTAMLLLKSSLFLSLHLAGNAGSFPKPLSPEEEDVYLARCARHCSPRRKWPSQRL